MLHSFNVDMYNNVNCFILFKLQRYYNILLDGECKMESTPKEWNHAKCKEAPHDCYDGIIHVDECQGGAPIIMSSPYFYNGDEDLAGFFEPPLKPNKDLHDTILDIEPITAIALNAHKRIQVHNNLHCYKFR